MAKTKKAKKAKAKATKAAATKKVKVTKVSAKKLRATRVRAMTKRHLINDLGAHIYEQLGDRWDMTEKDAARLATSVLEALTVVMARELGPDGRGVFVLPRLLKVSLKDKPAIKPGTLVRTPATGGMVPSKGRPASKTVKIRPLVGLKEAAKGSEG